MPELPMLSSTSLFVPENETGMSSLETPPFSPLQFLITPLTEPSQTNSYSSFDVSSFDFPYMNFFDVSDEHATNTSGSSNASSAGYSDSDVDIETVEESGQGVFLPQNLVPAGEPKQPSVPPTCESERAEDPVLNHSKPIQVLLKPARKNSHKYLAFFPSKIYCAPYKYDLLVRLPASSYQGRTLNIILNSAETQTKLKCKSQDQIPIVIEKTKATPSTKGVVEIMCRIRFNVCSFHYNKKPFSLRLVFSTSDAEPPLEYVSEPFCTYARKNDKDDIWDRKGCAPMYSEVATKSLRSRSRGPKRKHKFEESPKKRPRLDNTLEFS